MGRKNKRFVYRVASASSSLERARARAPWLRQESTRECKILPQYVPVP
jgi:hypothetical protein